MQAGLSPMQMITAATGSAARFLGAKDLGTLEVGKWADLIVLQTEPARRHQEFPHHQCGVYRRQSSCGPGPALNADAKQPLRFRTFRFA